jgi:hypothetical protein
MRIRVRPFVAVRTADGKGYDARIEAFDGLDGILSTLSADLRIYEILGAKRLEFEVYTSPAHTERDRDADLVPLGVVSLAPHEEKLIERFDWWTVTGCSVVLVVSQGRIYDSVAEFPRVPRGDDYDSVFDPKAFNGRGGYRLVKAVFTFKQSFVVHWGGDGQGEEARYRMLTNTIHALLCCVEPSGGDDARGVTSYESSLKGRQKYLDNRKSVTDMGYILAESKYNEKTIKEWTRAFNREEEKSKEVHEDVLRHFQQVRITIKQIRRDWGMDVPDFVDEMFEKVVNLKRSGAYTQQAPKARGPFASAV